MKEVPVGKGAYNVEPSPDGKLIMVTNKKDQSVSLVDAVKLTEIARIPTSKKVVHGIAYSPDGRLAYVSSESVGADPGAVDVIDLSPGRWWELYPSRSAHRYHHSHARHRPRQGAEHGVRGDHDTGRRLRFCTVPSASSPSGCH